MIQSKKNTFRFENVFMRIIFTNQIAFLALSFSLV